MCTLVGENAAIGSIKFAFFLFNKEKIERRVSLPIRVHHLTIKRQVISSSRGQREGIASLVTVSSRGNRKREGKTTK